MNLTAGQTDALAKVAELQKTKPDGGGIGIVSGYAGTGKTTLLRVLQNEHEEEFLVVTPTGKAAVRVREATGARAITIHRWLYEVKEDEDTGQLEGGLKPLEKVERPRCGFLVCDEASMVTSKVFHDLKNYCKAMELNLILVGDSFQLPPVEMDQTLKEFTVFDPAIPADFRVNLTEILRQALDSPIIRASMEIRTGRWVEEALGMLPAVSAKDLYPAANTVFEKGGATICHRNATRHLINAGVRQVRGLAEGVLKQGEPLMVTQNNYDLELYNGEITDVGAEPTLRNLYPLAVVDRFRNANCTVSLYETTVKSPVLGPGQAIVADKEVFGALGDVGAHCVRREAVFRGYARPTKGGTEETMQRPAYLSANLGYAATAHKSQGSEYSDVLVVLEDSLRLNSLDGKRWCYVAVTRAKKNIAICWKR